MIYVKPVFLFFISILYIGCTTTYKSPEKGPTAELIVKAKNLREITFGKSYAEIEILNTRQRCEVFVRRPMIEIDLDEPEKKVVVPAGNKVYLRSSYKADYYLIMNSHSTHNISFVPENGQKYFVEIIVDPEESYFNHDVKTRFIYYKKIDNSEEVQGFETDDWDKCP